MHLTYRKKRTSGITEKVFALSCINGIIVTLFLLLSGTLVGAQNITTDKARTAVSDSIPTVDSTHNDLLADLFDNDTVKVTYVQYGRRHTLLPFSDSLLSASLRQMDVARAGNMDYLTLGNIGSPALNPLFKPCERTAFDMGVHGFDLYRITFDKFKFYRPETPYTEVRYGTTTGVRDDNIFTGKFSRKFATNLTFNLDYARFNQVGEFLRDGMRNTTLGIGFEQSHWKNRYKTHLIYIFNQFLREENGGISKYLENIEGGPSGSRLSMPINIDAGGSKYKEWGILLNNDFTILRKKNPSAANTSDQGLHVGYEISYHKENNLFYDTNVRSTDDSAYYRYYNSDIRGIRNNYDHKVFLNRVYLAAVGKELTQVYNTADYLRGGLALERHHLIYLPTDSVFSLLRLEGEGHWSLANFAGISAHGYYLLNSLTPIFHAEGRITGKIGRILQAEAWLEISNQSPGYLLRNLHFNSTSVFRLNEENTFHTYVGGKIMIPAIRLEAGLHQNIIRNFTYIDQNWVGQQINHSVSVTGIEAVHRLKIKAFHLDNTLLWQLSSDDQLRVPQWVSRHAAYVEGRLFSRKLTINAGVEGRILAGYNRQGYSPVLFNFYNIEGAGSTNMFTYDAFISYKIRLMRGFVRVDNINSLYNKRAQYQVAQYPIDAFAVRLGFDWIFNN